MPHDMHNPWLFVLLVISTPPIIIVVCMLMDFIRWIFKGDDK